MSETSWTATPEIISKSLDSYQWFVMYLDSFDVVYSVNNLAKLAKEFNDVKKASKFAKIGSHCDIFD